MCPKRWAWCSIKVSMDDKVPGTLPAHYSWSHGVNNSSVTIKSPLGNKESHRWHTHTKSLCPEMVILHTTLRRILTVPLPGGLNLVTWSWWTNVLNERRLTAAVQAQFAGINHHGSLFTSDHQPFITNHHDRSLSAFSTFSCQPNVGHHWPILKQLNDPWLTIRKPWRS